MNVRLTFTPTLRSQIVNVVTIDDNIFEDDEHICLRLTNLTEPCPSSVILANDTEVVIAEDEGKFATNVFINIKLVVFCLHTVPVFTLQCYTNTTGNSIVGRNISLFYSSAAMEMFFPQFQCALNDGDLAPCMLIQDCRVLAM